jgi:hypothetical protein
MLGKLSLMLTSGGYGIVNLFDDKIYIGSATYSKDRFSWHFIQAI